DDASGLRVDNEPGETVAAGNPSAAASRDEATAAPLPAEGFGIAGVEPALPVAAEEGERVEDKSSTLTLNVAGSGGESPGYEEVVAAAAAAADSSTTRGGERAAARMTVDSLDPTEVGPTLPVAAKDAGLVGDESALTLDVAGSGEEPPEHEEVAAVDSFTTGGDEEAAAPLAVDGPDPTDAEPILPVATEERELTGDETPLAPDTAASGEEYPDHKEVATVDSSTTGGDEEAAAPLAVDGLDSASVEQTLPVASIDGNLAGNETPLAPDMAASGEARPDHEEVAAVDSSTTGGDEEAAAPLAVDGLDSAGVEQTLPAATMDGDIAGNETPLAPDMAASGEARPDHEEVAAVDSSTTGGDEEAAAPLALDGPDSTDVEQTLPAATMDGDIAGNATPLAPDMAASGEARPEHEEVAAVDSSTTGGDEEAAAPLALDGPDSTDVEQTLPAATTDGDIAGNETPLAPDMAASGEARPDHEEVAGDSSTTGGDEEAAAPLALDGLDSAGVEQTLPAATMDGDIAGNETPLAPGMAASGEARPEHMEVVAVDSLIVGGDKETAAPLVVDDRDSAGVEQTLPAAVDGGGPVGNEASVTSATAGSGGSPKREEVVTDNPSAAVGDEETGAPLPADGVGIAGVDPALPAAAGDGRLVEDEYAIPLILDVAGSGESPEYDEVAAVDSSTTVGDEEAAAPLAMDGLGASEGEPTMPVAAEEEDRAEDETTLSLHVIGSKEESSKHEDAAAVDPFTAAGAEEATTSPQSVDDFGTTFSEDALMAADIAPAVGGREAGEVTAELVVDEGPSLEVTRFMVESAEGAAVVPSTAPELGPAVGHEAPETAGAEQATAMVGEAGVQDVVEDVRRASVRQQQQQQQQPAAPITDGVTVEASRQTRVEPPARPVTVTADDIPAEERKG
ncbi:unnamed protein product, partial [Pylaiella littoralis]